MDEILLALSESLARSGPEWVFALGVLAVFAFKLTPVISRWTEAHSGIEAKREERKAEEARMRDEHDREMAQLNGKWLVVSEQSAKAMEGMTAQMQVLNATLADSKERSREMAREVHEIHTATVPGRPEGTD